MSSKGRGAPVADAEFYPTPAWCTRRILETLDLIPPAGYVGPNRADALRLGSWLEPCAGDGAITGVLRSSARFGEALISGGDIRDIPAPASVGHWNKEFDFRGYDTRVSAVITNPPFSLAPALIDHFLPRCDWLILLLRASFRLAPWRDNMPDEYKLPQRPEFLASEKCRGTRAGGYKNRCGWVRKVSLDTPHATHCPVCGILANVQRSTSDSSEYSWFVWTPERGRSAGLTRVLPDTPLSERREGR